MKRISLLVLVTLATVRVTCNTTSSVFVTNATPKLESMLQLRNAIATRLVNGYKSIVTHCNGMLQSVAALSKQSVSETNNLLYSEKYSQQFADTLQRVATRLQFKANWLLQVMQAESGINPRATNRIGATGLIQFLPATARALGTTCTELATMNATQQLHYVEKFYQPVAGKIYSVADLRLYTFFPAALHQPNSFVLATETLPAHVVAARNATFDLNNDKQITKQEFLTAIQP